MTRKVTLETLNGPHTIEGLTVATARKLLEQAPDDAVCVFMFEITPTVREQMAKVNLMIMPCHQVHGSDQSEICAFVGPEIENAKFEHHYQKEPPPVDRTKQCTTSGETPEEVRLKQAQDPEGGQHDSYIVLCEEERKRGFVRPLRRSYVHVGPGGHEINPNDPSKHGRTGSGCGVETRMGTAIAETYARDPKFYTHTFCVGCNKHFPVEEFVWADAPDQRVGS